MISTILEFLGLVKKLFTGDYAKYGVYAVFIMSLLIGVWWVTDKYGDMKALAVEQKALINVLTTSNVEAQLALSKVIEERDSQRKSYDTALANRSVLESRLASTVKEKDDALKVFEKECGRIERLMQKKASLIVRYANRATNRLHDDFREATRSDSDSDSN